MVKAVGQTRLIPRELMGPLVIFCVMPVILCLTILMLRRLESDERYQVDLSRSMPSTDLAVDATPDAVAEMIELSLEQNPLPDGPVSIFDKDLFWMVKQTYESNPWVRRVKSIERRFPRSIDVDLELRQPYAAIDRSGEYLLADSYGELLPVRSSEALAEPPFITLERGSPDSTHLDETWFRDAVREGIFVLADLEAASRSVAFDLISIESIDVSNFGGRHSPIDPEVVLVTTATWQDDMDGTTHPVTISWGRSTQHAKAIIELPVERKIEHLEGALRTRPDLVGVKSIDVRFDFAYLRNY